MQVRTEQIEDIAAIRKINIAAFGRENEADLVDRLRGTAGTLSFVAVVADCLVGHIFYSPVAIGGAGAKDVRILGLAPLAVLPEYQRQGVGSVLIQHSLKECTRSGIQAIVVLGHPTYYPRFGFTPAQAKGLNCEYGVSSESFMVLELEPSALSGCVGTIEYRSEFRECE